MHTTEQKYNDLIKFSNHDLSLKEEELFTIYQKLVDKADVSDDRWYTEQKFDCLFDLLAVREWMRLKGIEVPERTLLKEVTGGEKK